MSEQFIEFTSGLSLENVSLKPLHEREKILVDEIIGLEDEVLPLTIALRQKEGQFAALQQVLKSDSFLTDMEESLVEEQRAYEGNLSVLRLRVAKRELADVRERIRGLENYRQSKKDKETIDQQKPYIDELISVMTSKINEVYAELDKIYKQHILPKEQYGVNEENARKLMPEEIKHVLESLEDRILVLEDFLEEINEMQKTLLRNVPLSKHDADKIKEKILYVNIIFKKELPVG